MSERSGPTTGALGNVRRTLGLDLRSLALFRVLFGATLFIDALVGARDLDLYFTDAGVLPREAAALLPEAKIGLSIHVFGGSIAWAASLTALTAAAALAFTLGLHTRVASVVLFALTLSAQIRNPLILQGSDYIARVVLFGSMFLPLGERASIDAIRARAADPTRRARPPSTEVVFSPAAVGLAVQIALIYWASAALKTDDAWRASGTAVYYVLNVPSIATPLGRLIGEHPDLCRTLTFATMGLEVVGPLLLFVPLGRGGARLAAAALFIGFHAALHVCMKLGPFSFVAASIWTAFLPPLVWDSIATRPLLTRAAAWIDARARSCLPPRRTSTIPQKLSFIHLYSSRSADAVAGLATLFVVALNGGTLFGPRFQAPRAFVRASLALGLNQEWGMFAPSPPRGDTWLAFEGLLSDGRSVDALNAPAPIDWDRAPPSPFPRSPGENYVTGVSEPFYKSVRPYLAQWICRRANAASPQDPLQSIRIHLVIQEVALPGRREPPRTTAVLWEGRCP